MFFEGCDLRTRFIPSPPGNFLGCVGQEPNRHGPHHDGGHHDHGDGGHDH